MWKEYQRGAQKERYLSLRDSLLRSLKPSSKKESFWALQDINFEVHPGDSLAIIGKNGAGKSTLLKILSRITPPTKGEIILRGRLASLLEVGTGFHPELTGRENVFLNGSILGLGRSEINRQFDAIVDFSGVEAFLDTPLKHYSSGMQLRLAFAVAAHLEPEILVIDEVLAVGDSVFQKKCIAKMTEVSNSGRTIIFVSHNLKVVRNLCRNGVLLNNGQQLLKGNIEEVVDTYRESSNLGERIVDLTNYNHRQGKGELKFSKLEFLSDRITSRMKIEFKVSLVSDFERRYRDLDLSFAITDLDNSSLIHIGNKFVNEPLDYDGSPFIISISNILKNGSYKLVLFLKAEGVIQDWISDGIIFKIHEGTSGYETGSKGLILPNFEIIKE